jgi:hypothetical protein
MSKHTLFAAALLAAMPALAEAADIRDVPAPFSADMKLTVEGQAPTVGKINASPGMSRMDYTAPDGHEIILISRFDLNTAYVLDPDTKTYSELPARNMDKNPWDPVHAHLAGGQSDTAGAGPATKYILTSTGGHYLLNGFVWKNSAGIIVKSQIEARRPVATADNKDDPSGGAKPVARETLELTNIRPGSQDAALFQPPATYKFVGKAE